MSNYKRVTFALVTTILSTLLIELVSSSFIQYNTFLRTGTVVLYLMGFLWFYTDICNIKDGLHVKYSICSAIFAAAGIGCVLSATAMFKPTNEVVFAFGVVFLATCAIVFITFIKLASHYASEIQGFEFNE